LATSSSWTTARDTGIASTFAQDDVVKGKSHEGLLGFRVIGAFKLLSAVLLAAMGVGIFKVVNRDLGEVLNNLALSFRLDPGNHFIHSIIANVSGIDRAHLHALGVGTFFYAIVHVIEGVGLLLKRRWAGYVTVFVTSSLLPFEGYEVFRKADALRVGALILNLAIVVYVIIMLRLERRSWAEADKAATDSASTH
jgi:uncharacterized membrane protein (DUF2068 family)